MQALQFSETGTLNSLQVCDVSRPAEAIAAYRKLSESGSEKIVLLP